MLKIKTGAILSFIRGECCEHCGTQCSTLLCATCSQELLDQIEASPYAMTADGSTVVTTPDATLDDS